MPPASSSSRSLSDADLLSLLRREEQAAAGYQDSALSAHRQQAMAYYDREPYGTEEAGRSQVVTSEFADAVESIMPGLMRVFTGSDSLATFAPLAPGQERWAREASDYVPHVLMRQNDGFRIVSGLLKDALMHRLGGVAVDVETEEDTTVVPLQDLPPDAVDLLIAAAEGQGASAAVDAEAATLAITRPRRRVVVEGIAPEDIRFSPAARDEDSASFVGFVKRASASDLARLGLSPGEIDDLRSDGSETSVEEAQRTDGLVGSDARALDGDSERPLWLVVAWIRADDDGDGISERLRVVYTHAGGTAGRIVERARWEGPAGVALATPILMPHALVGRSLFDQTKDLQELGSVLTRGLLDNLYVVNQPRPVISDQVNIDSLIDWVPGSPVRLKPGARPSDNHVTWLQVPNITGGALAALEHFATVRENRTGVSRYNQGLDAESLNKTLGGLDRIMSASQQRQDLIARVFAETAIKRLYRLIYRAIKRAATGPISYWTGKRDRFASCDPSQWPDELELSVDVVGIYNREQALGHLATIGGLQEKLVALQGGRANGPFVTAENIAAAAQKLTEVLGYKTAGLFFEPPDQVAAAQAEPTPQAVDPALQLAQAQIEIQRERARAEIAIRRDKTQADIAIAAFKARQWAEIEWRKAARVAG
ncbi:portal protein [Reyranella sp.]|uniref:portal protein n=1 Tax=Reyranella sp. TaxID=1929291 RepID=UPI003BAC92A2